MKHIRAKLNLTYIALTVLVLAVAGFIISVELEAYFRRWLANDLETRAELILASMESGGQNRDEQMKSLAHAADARITFINADGKVIFDSEVAPEKMPSVENHLLRPEIQQAMHMDKGTDVRHSATVGVDYFYMAKRIHGRMTASDLHPIEFIRLSVPLTELKATSREIRLNIVFAGIVVLIVVLLVSTLISRRITRPLVNIANVAKEIREGNLDSRITITSNDEIGQVSHAVNDMIDRLKTDIVQLKKLEQVRSQFLGNVSHELRTPIFALQGYLETLLDGAIDDPTVNRDFLEKAYSNAMRLNTLLNDLIDISRIESGEMKMSFRYFNVKKYIEEVVTDLQSVAAARKIRLSIRHSADDSLQALGDQNRLIQVLTNLIDNAIKYTPNKGSVVVQTRIDENLVWIDVIDSGIGITQEHLPRIFERFYRVDKERSREAGGTGLGLAIVKHIVEAHGGSVHVQSAVGEGSTFSFPLKR